MRMRLPCSVLVGILALAFSQTLQAQQTSTTGLQAFWPDRFLAMPQNDQVRLEDLKIDPVKKHGDSLSQARGTFSAKNLTDRELLVSVSIMLIGGKKGETPSMIAAGTAIVHNSDDFVFGLRTLKPKEAVTCTIFLGYADISKALLYEARVWVIEKPK